MIHSLLYCYNPGVINKEAGGKLFKGLFLSAAVLTASSVPDQTLEPGHLPGVFEQKGLSQQQEVAYDLRYRTFPANKITSPLLFSLCVGLDPLPTDQITNKLTWPVRGVISNYFLSGHPGLDIGQFKGHRVQAADSGEVVASLSGLNGGYGNVIVAAHPGSLMTLYAHLSERGVKVGDKVRQGEVIGKVGSTGNSTGPHLHFEVMVHTLDGCYSVNPLVLLPK